MLRRMLPYRLVPHNGRRVFRRRASRPVLVVCFAFGVVVGSSCSKTEPPETVAPGQATTALNDVVDSLTRTLAAPVPSAPTPCDDAVLRGKLGASAAKVLLAPRQQLSAWVLGDKPAANDAEFLNTRLLEGISLRVSSEEQAIIELTKFRELQEKRPFLGVLELDEWRSPAVDGVAFKGGEVSGTLSLFELGQSQLLCMVEVNAGSSEEVPQRAGEALTEAVTKDFQARVRRATQDAVGQLSRRLSP